MNSTLPPDPYKVLGVTKDSKLPEIRSAHRKLVLKCHPDKVQDAALKAIKQDEFQKVQQAYELLSDDSRRLQYDEQVKLFELRKEMGRGNPTPRSNPFEYEVKTAEPRPNSYGRSKVYSHPTSAPRSNEDLYEEPRHMPRKSASNESAAERKRAAMKEEELRYRAKAAREMEDERLRQKERDRERERDRESRRAHGEKKKSKDKDKRRGTEEKVRTRHTYAEDDSSDDDVHRARMERKQRQRLEEEIRIREEAARVEAAAREAARKQQERASIKEAPLAEKWSDHRDFAGAYMQAARRKVAPIDTDLPAHPGMRRAETFSASPSGAYNIRYAAPPQPQYSDDDLPKRSSATRKESSRRSSETPAVRTEKSSRRRSPTSAHTKDPYINIVEPPSPTSAPRKPALQSYSSAPANFAREIPVRSKTEYPRKDTTIPSLPRAQTFQAGDRGRDRPNGSSKLRQEYTSESEPDSPVFVNQRSHSPPRRPQEPTREPTATRYIVENGRTVPVVTARPHRAEMRNVDGDYTRERSESPRGTPSRPPISRNPPSRSQSTSYHFPSEVPEPIVLTSERPKLHREGSSNRASSRGAQKGSYFDNVQYATKYTDAHVVYSPAAGATGVYDNVRRGSEGRERDYYPHTSYRQGPIRT